MVQLPIQSKKQGDKKSCGMEVGGEWSGQNVKKGEGIGNIGMYS